MRKSDLAIILISFLILISNNSGIYSQNIPVSKNFSFENSELKSKILNQNNENQIKQLDINSVSAGSNKSPGLALLFSLILPGAGHYYINRMDVGKYYLGVDAASWIGYAALSVYGNDVRSNSKTYALQHAEIGSTDGKNSDFFTNIGSYDNVYDYNNAKLSFGEYSLLYDVNTYYWNWDAVDNLNTYESQRKSSERIYNSRIIFGSILIMNRVVSGISSYLLASKKGDKSKSVSVVPEVMYKNDYSFDGIKINLSKNF